MAIKLYGHSKREITYVGLIEVPDFESANSAKRWIREHLLDIEKIGIRCIFIGDSFSYYEDIKKLVRHYHMF